MKRVYATLCVLGFLLPGYFLFQFVIANGLNVSLFMSRLFGNQIAAFFAADVVISSVVLWVFIYRETSRRSIPQWWLCILANLAVGLSLGLPLFLMLREMAREKLKSPEG